MRIITIGGLPAAGKTYTSRLVAEKNNYLALEVEKIRWDYFNENLKENMYKYTKNIPMLENENMREYYLRCTLYESKIPLDVMVKWHKNTMKYIGEKLISIIEKIKLIKTEKDYIEFCKKNEKLMNYIPKFEKLNNEIIICSHAFINTIIFFENERTRIDFQSDMNILIERFKQRENITENKFDKNIKIYYKSYEDVLKDSVSNILDTNSKNVIEEINNLI